MKIYCLANQKGGVSKTTTASALGASLARRKGAKVLLIDLDGQGNLTAASGAEIGKGFNSLDVLTGKARIKDALQWIDKKTAIVPASPLLSLVLGEELKHGTRSLKSALREAEGEFSAVVIDTPPALGVLTLTALTAAHEVLIPASADAFGIKALRDLFSTVRAVQTEGNKALTVSGVLLTRYNRRGRVANIAREQIETLCNEAGTRLLKSSIRECAAIREAQILGKSIFDYAPKSNAANDYAAAFKEITAKQ